MAGRRILAPVALLGCLMAGCSGAESDPPADAAPSSSSPSSDSPSATQPQPTASTVDVPTMPGRAGKDTLEGAEAFVRHYIDLLNYATATGQVRELHDAAHRCKSCSNYEKLYKETYARGGYMRYAGWKLTHVQAFDQRGEYVVLATVHAPRIRYRLRANAEEKVGPSATYKFRFETKRRHRRWVVTDFSQQALPEGM